MLTSTVKLKAVVQALQPREGAYRQDPLFLGPNPRSKGPAGTADPGVEQGPPVLWPVHGQCLHIMLHVQQGAVSGSVHDFIQGEDLRRLAALDDAPQRHEVGLEEVALCQRGCAQW